jgi:hypothetical protein
MTSEPGHSTICCSSGLLDLNCFFGDKTVGNLKAQLCRDFVDWSTGTPNENNRQAGIKSRQGKVSDQTARRRLEDLRAAVNVYHAEHTLSVVPKITLPPKAEGRHRWLRATKPRACSVLQSATCGITSETPGNERKMASYCAASAGSSADAIRPPAFA